MTARTLRIGLRVEGASDEQFFSALLPRLIPVAPDREVRVTMVTVARRERAPATIAKRLCEAVADHAIDLACVHQDGQSAQRRDMAATFAREACHSAKTLCRLPGIRCVPILPMREMEAWVLADPEALGHAFGIRDIDPRLITDLVEPERIDDPKQKLQDLLKALKVRRRTQLPFALLAELTTIERLRRCISFAEFEPAFRAACDDVLEA